MNNEIKFDSLLRMAIRETYMDQLDAIPPEDELEKTLAPSQTFIQKINRIVRKENRNEKLIYMSRSISKVAVVIMMFVSLSFASLMTAEAVRESVATTILEWHDKFTRIFIETDAQPEKLPEIRFNYIPEGFELVEDGSYSEYEYILRTYMSNDQKFCQIMISASNEMNIYEADNEHSSIYSIKIENVNAIWISSEHENQLYVCDKYFYRLSGNMPLEKIIKIYKNIEIL